ncbi:MAG: 3-dehydroquinate synthase [Kangiellaceae bacterium]
MCNVSHSRSLKVNLKDADYSIYIGSSLISQQIDFLTRFTGSKALIVTNPIVAPLYNDQLEYNLIEHGLRTENIHSIQIEDGEINKNKESFFLLLDYLIENNFKRNDLIIALGGGVIGDLTGFVAASFQRGMNLIQIPTTLLSQVDSSVGGKTAINHTAGKNLIGAFYQPKQVIIDIDTLASLPDREYISGLGEVVKYAFLGELNILELLLHKHHELLSRERNVLADIIYLSCQKKASIVAEDEKEMGKRAILNLGHTFAHALETLTQYTHYLHGEAVSIGMVMALSLSVKKKLLEQETLNTAIKILTSLKLPIKSDLSFSVTDFLNVMAKDKKNQTDSLRLVLVNEHNPIIVEESDKTLIASVIEEYTAN